MDHYFLPGLLDGASLDNPKMSSSFSSSMSAFLGGLHDIVGLRVPVSIIKGSMKEHLLPLDGSNRFVFSFHSGGNSHVKLCCWTSLGNHRGCFFGLPLDELMVNWLVVTNSYNLP
ncbi:hypothetical protein SAY86_023914 [Trapa natans]|uniref:Uncharacterized protein n=1 Tax=Trapa natans TaxID=22666 RepID=A0AAN7LWJ5_TRANT|nr:hypothetical protein SAY86_023914 [Trapa natans]